MECHAWFVTFPLGTEKSVKEQGKLSVVKKKPKLCKRHNGEWYLDPGVPETADYILSLVKEIVNGYDIDGVRKSLWQTGVGRISTGWFTVFTIG